MFLEKKFLKIGHRGAAGYEPENTIASFKKAVELGIDMVEFDVQLCKSGELVVIHDRGLERTTNGRGRVQDKTLAELKKLDAGKGQDIPTVEEVLPAVGRKISVNIELKGPKTALPAAELIDKYVEEKGWDQDRFLVSSFCRNELSRFRIFDPFTRIGVLFDSLPRDLFDFAADIKCYSINPAVGLATVRLIDDAHARGLKVFVWTVNSTNIARRLVEMGVDGIFSDFPDRLAAIESHSF